MATGHWVVGGEKASSMMVYAGNSWRRCGQEAVWWSRIANIGRIQLAMGSSGPNRDPPFSPGPGLRAAVSNALVLPNVMNWLVQWWGRSRCWTTVITNAVLMLAQLLIPNAVVIDGNIYSLLRIQIGLIHFGQQGFSLAQSLSINGRLLWPFQRSGNIAGSANKNEHSCNK